MARLVIFDDAVRGFELPDREVIIGRSQKTDIPINDGLLSRKHCSILPGSLGHRLLDLKSSNGTYHNGERIEKVDLSADDVIEIGETVIVYLEEGVWSRGEALARLRNPIKAQELIARIKSHLRKDGKAERIPLRKIAPRSAEKPRGAEKSRRSGRSRRTVVNVGAEALPGLLESLEEFISHRAVLLLLKESPSLRGIVSEVLSDVFGRGGPKAAAVPRDLRTRIGAALRQRLTEKGSSAMGPAAPGDPGAEPGRAGGSDSEGPGDDGIGPAGERR